MTHEHEGNSAEPFAPTAAGARKRLKRAKKSYDQMTNRLWAGNAAGALAGFGALGSGKVSGIELSFVICMFLLGLLALGMGSAASLVTQVLRARAWEKEESMMDLKMQHILRPTEEVGLVPNFQTFMVITAALTFVIGVALALHLAFKGL
jgi:hypothetical protein